MKPLVRSRRDGSFDLNLPTDTRDVIDSLLVQLRELITERDSVAWRLFPNAYQDDPEAAAEYEDMVGDDLRSRRLAAIETVQRTVKATSLSEEELLAWMAAVNDLRLVLGTRLDIDEHSDIDDYNTTTARSLFAAFGFLGWLLEEIVTSLPQIR